MIWTANSWKYCNDDCHGCDWAQIFSGLNWIPLHFSEFWRWSGFVLFIPLPSSNVETGIWKRRHSYDCGIDQTNPLLDAWSKFDQSSGEGGLRPVRREMPVGRVNGRTYLHNNVTPSLFHYQHIRTAQAGRCTSYIRTPFVNIFVYICTFINYFLIYDPSGTTEQIHLWRRSEREREKDIQSFLGKT